jgi:hypothetical protein
VAPAEAETRARHELGLAMARAERTYASAARGLEEFDDLLRTALARLRDSGYLSDLHYHWFLARLSAKAGPRLRGSGLRQAVASSNSVFARTPAPRNGLAGDSVSEENAPDPAGTRRAAAFDAVRSSEAQIRAYAPSAPVGADRDDEPSTATGPRSTTPS